MNLKQKVFYAISGFVLGNLLLASLVSGVSFLNKLAPQQGEVSFRQAAARIKYGVVRSVNVNSAESPSDRLMIQLFRVLFILFLISPPIIVVLLLVIISKMNRKDSMK